MNDNECSRCIYSCDRLVTGLLECRRHAPITPLRIHTGTLYTEDKLGQWPIVRKDDVCGDYIGREEARK